MIKIDTNKGIMRAEHEVTPAYNLIPKVTVISSTSQSNVTLRDSVYTRHTSATVKNEASIIPNGSYPVVYESLSSSIASVNDAGDVAVVSNGTAKIKAKVGYNVQELSISVSQTGGTTTDIFNSFVTGSLGKHIVDAVDSRITGKSPITSTPIFQSQNHQTQSYTRNSDLWCAALASQLTCASPWNSMSSNLRAGTLVTPRHILFAAHYPISDNTIIRFVDANGNVFNRTMLKQKVHPLYPGFQMDYDLVIGVLDSDLPESISPAQVLPSNYSVKIPGAFNRVPAVFIDQDEKLLIAENYLVNSPWTLRPTNNLRLPFHETAVVGDSGNPMFFLINNTFVLTSVITGSNSASGLITGTAIHNNLDAINLMINDADTLAGISGSVATPSWPNSNGHYQLKTIDLSSFSNY